jgi:hypothetical protein
MRLHLGQNLETQLVYGSNFMKKDTAQGNLKYTS